MADLVSTSKRVKTRKLILILLVRGNILWNIDLVSGLAIYLIFLSAMAVWGAYYEFLGSQICTERCQHRSGSSLAIIDFSKQLISGQLVAGWHCRGN
jgi:hypothetical protein